ncbi:hypothetical protein P7C70_g2828, partial [Phenoliferia sp. Uapishka_3]
MVTLHDLPAELLYLILQDASTGLSFRLPRSLSSYSLVHPSFTQPAQSILFHTVLITSHAQAVALTDLARARPHIGNYVRTLRVVGRSVMVRNPIVAKGRGAEGKVMDVLGDIVVICPRIRRLKLVDVLFEPGLCLKTIESLTSLSLHSTTLATFKPHSFPLLHHLSISNTDATFLRYPLDFPALKSLAYHNALLDTAELPVVRLDAFAHTGPHLRHLTVGRMFDPTVAWEEDDDGISGMPRPSLEPFVGLETLTLLADSSHRARAYFPLLVRFPTPTPFRPLSRSPCHLQDSLSATSHLHTFRISTSLGYRDKQQEVHGMASELSRRLRAESFARLKEVELTKEFRSFENDEGMKGLLEVAVEMGVGVRYWEG